MGEVPLHLVHEDELIVTRDLYMATSLIKKRHLVGPYSRIKPRLLSWC